jgi:uncharacterized metal-binding protein YceD (DUF177 family)
MSKKAFNVLPHAHWRYVVPVHEVPAVGRHVVLDADEKVRRAIAEEAGLRSLPRLQADFQLTREGHDGLRLVGRVTATVGQVCVVTLEPIETHLEEPVDLVFAPHKASPGPPAGAVEMGIDNDQEVEPLVNGGIDLGAIAIEFLLLGLDPYPRKADVAFEPPAIVSDDANPFAALAALRQRPDGKKG